jgi:hypothetical protein
VLLPRIDEAVQATSSGATLAEYQMQGARAAAAARWIESASLTNTKAERAALRDELVLALTRYSAASAEVASAGGKLVIRRASAAGDVHANVKLSVESWLKDTQTFAADAADLALRCGILQPTAATIEAKDCVALAELGEHLVRPEPASVMAFEHAEHCLLELAAIRGSSPEVERRLRSLESAARGLLDVARTRLEDKPAIMVIETVRVMTRALGAQTSAQRDVASASARLRSTCEVSR